MDTVGTETVCYRHPKRETYVRCSRCDRHICSDCMREAPVGQRCPDCVKGENKGVRQARTIFGGRTVGTPWVTYTLITLNVLAYVAELIDPSLIDRFDVFGAGLQGPDGALYLDEGTSFPGYIPVGVLHGEWWRLFTGAFLHQLPGGSGIGLTHILFNMVWLWILGRFLEEKLGRIRYVALYLLAALGGSTLVILVEPAQSAIGASGAGFGLAAAYFVVTRKLHEHPIDRNQLLISFVLWLVLTAGFTSWEGHLGGLIAGAAVAISLAYAPRRNRTAVQVVALVAIGFVLVAALVLQRLTM